MSVNLEEIRSQTTWGDAARDLNLNQLRIKEAIEQLQSLIDSGSGSEGDVADFEELFTKRLTFGRLGQSDWAAQLSMSLGDLLLTGGLRLSGGNLRIDNGNIILGVNSDISAPSVEAKQPRMTKERRTIGAIDTITLEPSKLIVIDTEMVDLSIEVPETDSMDEYWLQFVADYGCQVMLPSNVAWPLDLSYSFEAGITYLIRIRGGLGQVDAFETLAQG